MRATALELPVRSLPGVGEAMADLLAKLQVGVRCVGRHPARQGGAGPWSACVALCSGAACALERAAGVWWGWIDWLHALLLPPP